VVFTGGVGEHVARVRQLVADGLAFLGVTIDHDANAKSSSSDRDVSELNATVRTLVVAAREDLEMARKQQTAWMTLLTPAAN
jgi:acetate kinase